MTKPLDAQPKAAPPSTNHDVFVSDLLSPSDDNRKPPKTDAKTPETLAHSASDGSTTAFGGLIDLLRDNPLRPSREKLPTAESPFKLLDPARGNGLDLPRGFKSAQEFDFLKNRDSSPLKARPLGDTTSKPTELSRAAKPYQSRFGGKQISYLDLDNPVPGKAAKPPIEVVLPPRMAVLEPVPAADKTDGKKPEVQKVEPPKSEQKPEAPKVEPTTDEKKPDDKKPEDKKPDEKKPDEKKPEDKKPEEKKPEEKKPEEKKPEDKKPDEKKPDEKKPEDKKPEEKKPEDTKPQDKKPEETKPEDQKTEDGKPGEKTDGKPESKPSEKLEDKPAVEKAPPPRPVPVKGADGKGVYESTEGGGWTFKPKFGETSSEHADFPGEKISNVESQTDGSVKVTLDSGKVVRELPEGGRVHFADDAAFQSGHPSGVAGKTKDVVWDGDKIKSYYSESQKATYYQVAENSWTTDPKAPAEKGWKGEIKYDGSGTLTQVTMGDPGKGDRSETRANGISQTTHADGSVDVSVPYSDRTKVAFKFKSGFEPGKDVLTKPEEVKVTDPSGTESVWKKIGENEYQAGETKWKAEIQLTKDGTYSFKDLETGERSARYKSGIAERETPADKTATVKEDGRLTRVKVGDDVLEITYETNPDKAAKPSANEQPEPKIAAPGNLLAPETKAETRHIDTTGLATETTTKQAFVDAKAANIPVISLVTDSPNPNVQKALAYLGQQKLAATIDISKSTADQMMNKGLEPTQFNTLWGAKGANITAPSYLTAIKPSGIGADFKAEPKVGTPSDPEGFVKFLKDSGVDLSKPEDEKAVLALLAGKSPKSVEAEKVSVRPSEYRHVNQNLKLTREADGSWTESAIDNTKPVTKLTKLEKDMYTHNDLTPVQKLRLKDSMTKFNAMDKFDAAEKDKVNFHADRLLNGRKDSVMTSAEKANLADQLYWHIVNDGKNEQGNVGTCSVTTLRGKGLKELPSVVARVTADIANDGQLVTNDGSTIKPKMSSVRARPGSMEENFPPKSGNRSQLGKLWDVAVVNVYSQRATVDPLGAACAKGAMCYEEVAPTGRGDSGSRAVKTNPDGSQLVLHSSKQNGVLEPYDSPGSGYPSRMADIWNELTGQKLTDDLLVHTNRWVDNKETFKRLVGDQVGSEQALEKMLLSSGRAKIVQGNTGILEQRYKQQKAVDEGKDPATVPLPKGGEHVFLVTGYDPATKTVTVDNSWSSGYDVPNSKEAKANGKDTAKTVPITLGDLFKIMETQTSGESRTYSWVRR